MTRQRIDRLLVERGLADSRTKAQAQIMAGLAQPGEDESLLQALVEALDEVVDDERGGHERR